MPIEIHPLNQNLCLFLFQNSSTGDSLTLQRALWILHSGPILLFVVLSTKIKVHRLRFRMKVNIMDFVLILPPEVYHPFYTRYIENVRSTNNYHTSWILLESISISWQPATAFYCFFRSPLHYPTLSGSFSPGAGRRDFNFSSSLNWELCYFWARLLLRLQ